MSCTERNQIARKDELKVNTIDIESLDALETFDMSNVKMLSNIAIGDLNNDFNLVYPELTIFYNEDGRAGTTLPVQKALSIENQLKHS